MKLFSLLLAVTFLVLGVQAQEPVFDANTHALLSKGNSDYLAKMAETFQRMDEQLQTLEKTLQQNEAIVRKMGEPTQALEKIGGLGELANPVQNIQLRSLFRTGNDVALRADGAASLGFSGNGVYQAVAPSLPDGTPIEREALDYKPYAALEAEQANFAGVLDESMSERARLLAELDTVLATPATSEAEERARQTKILALQAALLAAGTKVRDANDQRQARAEANDNQRAKNEQAQREAAAQVEKRGVQEAGNPGWRN